MLSYNNELYHWGIKGMKWGVRRFQNKDGTLTPLGKKRLQEKIGEVENFEFDFNFHLYCFHFVYVCWT